MAIGFGLGPVALGWVADRLGSAHQAFLLVPVILAVAAALALWLGRSLAARRPAMCRQWQAGRPRLSRRRAARTQ